MNHPRLKILDGFAGRLGTTTFLAMNLVMVTLYGPLRVVDWERYWYGLAHVIHVADEERLPIASAWDWTEEVELSIGYCLACLWVGVLGGATRIKHDQYLQQWWIVNKPSSVKPQPTPLNNVLVPVLWALFSMLLVNATHYKHAGGLYNGFAVGAYVAMASLQKIPTVYDFFSVSLVAAGWGLALSPFFVGFPGKSGFTSMLGHVTHTALKMLSKKVRKRQQQELQQREQKRLQLQPEQEKPEGGQHQEKQVQEPPKHEEPYGKPSNLAQRQQQQRQQEQQERLQQVRPSRKHHKTKESLLTKQQIRQQQRLNHQRKQQRQSQQHSQTVQIQPHNPQLHHRAWTALAKEEDGIWQHLDLNTMV
jgi:hypothetical protein